MYLGMLLILAGALVLLGSFGPIVVAWLITTRFVHVEERMLEARFGDSYRPYKGSRSCRRPFTIS
jgi:protein-S-isoprenylcysteine O-methyltransferase Ste14